jgi:hypothetical protein
MTKDSVTARFNAALSPGLALEFTVTSPEANPKTKALNSSPASGSQERRAGKHAEARPYFASGTAGTG